MNRFDITFPSPESPAPLVPQLKRPVLPMPLLGVLPDNSPEQILTRRPKPVTSIRRLRHHRSAWPRRA